jgi:hypothetical protein
MATTSGSAERDQRGAFFAVIPMKRQPLFEQGAPGAHESNINDQQDRHIISSIRVAFETNADIKSSPGLKQKLTR